MGSYIKSKGLIQVYTDGSFNANNKLGGYGAVIFMNIDGVNKGKKYVSETSFSKTTSNRMEARAIMSALKVIDVEYTIDFYSDSTYCVNMLNRFWKDPYIKAHKNTKLWNEVFKEVKRHRKAGSKLSFNWVRSHSGNPFNELADDLARRGNEKPRTIVCDVHGEIVSSKKKE